MKKRQKKQKSKARPYKVYYVIQFLRSMLNKGVEMAQAKNYTEEMVNDMTTQYTANPTRETVDALAEQFGKTTRSIIAKL